MPRSLVLVEGRVVVAEVEGKILNRPLFRESNHPRDRKGRFIESGSTVFILGGSTGTVVSNAGSGRINVRRTDGKVVQVHRGNLTVLTRPNGGTPTEDEGKVDALPETPVATVPEADIFEVAGDVPDDADSGPSSDGRMEQAVEDALGPDMPISDDERISDEAWDRAPATEEYDLRASRLPEAINKIDKANRRAERAGIAERFGYSVERYETTVRTDREGNTLAFPYVEERARLTLDRPAVKHDGWTFVGTLSWDPDAGLVTRLVPDAVLTKRPEARECDVCHSKRDRKDTYVVQDPEGVQQQVGSNCMEQFLGIKPGNLWMLDWTVEEDDDEQGGGAVRAEDRRYPTTEFLGLVQAVADERGFTSRAAVTKAEEASFEREMSGGGRGTRLVATIDFVEDFTSGQMQKSEKEGGNPALFRKIQDRLAAPDLDARAAEVREYARNIDGDSEYASNLRAVAGADTVSQRNLALLASAVGAKMRHDGQVAERKARDEGQAGSVHLGEVGSKIADLPVKVTGTKQIDGNYGVTTLLTFLTEDGNVVKWFASGYRDEEIGDSVVIGGTVKGHDEHNGVPQTMLTRAKVRPGGSEGDAQVAAEAAQKAAAKAAAKVERDAAKVAVPEGMEPWGARPTTGDAALLPPDGSRIRYRLAKPKGAHSTARVANAVEPPTYGDDGRIRVQVQSEREGYVQVEVGDITAVNADGTNGGYRTWGEIRIAAEQRRADAEAARLEAERIRPYSAFQVAPGQRVIIDGVAVEVIASEPSRYPAPDGYKITFRLPDGTEDSKIVGKYERVEKDLS